ncbi:hypothetical protein [Priestia koreensis]|uniref:hypothetical protein n=1 Tax=Priestia koreensis TaxID=284581 RepID=UPI001F58ACE5|nr:hypothetical protein [Priestia koreensis]UNL83349.1 hypothetical protein IE339_14345 [Priestia koreensis]
MSKRGKIGRVPLYAVLILGVGMLIYRTDAMPFSYHHSKYNGEFPIPNHAKDHGVNKKRNVEQYVWGSDHMDEYKIPLRYQLAITLAGWKRLDISPDGENTPLFEKDGKRVYLDSYSDSLKGERYITIYAEN